jgi:DNA-binding protein HU-beta
MTKAELVAAMAAEADISRPAAEKALNGFMNTVKKTLRKGSRLSLTGFGTFSVSNRKARTGRNPQTGEKIRIRAMKVPRFSPGKDLKEAVGGKKK